MRVPTSLIEQLAAEAPAPKAKAKSPTAGQNGRHARNGAPHRNGTAGGESAAARRCRAYVARIPGAVAGDHGHDRTYQAARIVWNDFGLDDADGWPILAEFNDRCQPPWDEVELRRKWDEAIKAGAGPEGRGYRLRDDQGGTPVGNKEPGKEFSESLGEKLSDPRRAARTFFDRHIGTIVHYRDEFYRLVLARGAWAVVPDPDLVAELTQHAQSLYNQDAADHYAKQAAGESTEEEFTKPAVTKPHIGNIKMAPGTPGQPTGRDDRCRDERPVHAPKNRRRAGPDLRPDAGVLYDERPAVCRGT